MTGWRDRAACAHPSVRPQDFSPLDGRGRLDVDRARRLAVSICGPCPVRDACLAEARKFVPQGLVQGGLWWPVAPTGQPARPGPPIDLFALDDPAQRSTGAAA